MTQALHQVKNACERGAAAQSAFSRALVSRTISHRVRKRYSQFDEVGALPGQLMDQLKSGVEVGIAGSDIGDQCGFATPPQSGKGVSDARHRPIAIFTRLYP